MFLINYILLSKAIHIIAFVAWFAGLFYLVRMFVYHAEALNKEEPEKSILTSQLSLMEHRVYKIICNPAMMLCWTFGLVMLYLYGVDWLKTQAWMHLKLTLVFFLTIYHLQCKRIIKKFAAGKTTMNSFRFRLFNEVPTLFLVYIVLLAVYKNIVNHLFLLLGIICFGVILFLATKAYKKMRS